MSDQEKETENVAPANELDRSPEKTQEKSSDEDEYPHGLRLVAVVVSLVLGTFLVALDNVSTSNNNHNHEIVLTFPLTDNRFHRHPQDHRSIP